MTRKPFFAAVCFMLALASSGCFDTAQLEKAKAEAEAAKAEAAKLRSELDVMRQQLVKVEAELALARLELAKLKGTPPAATKPAALAQTDPSPPIEQRMASLRDLYNRGAINSDEYASAKIRAIEKLPAGLAITETR